MAFRITIANIFLSLVLIHIEDIAKNLLPLHLSKLSSKRIKQEMLLPDV